MADYKRRRKVEESYDETTSMRSISIRLVGRPSQVHDRRRPPPTNRAPTSNRRPASRSRPKERDRWRDELKEKTTFAKPSTKDFPMKAAQVSPVRSEEHPHFMRTHPRQMAVSIRLEKPESVQQGAVTPVSKAKRNWAGLRVVPSLVETPKVARYEFLLSSDRSRLTIINNQPIKQVAHFVAPQAERVESDLWRPEEYGFTLRTVQALDSPPPPFVAEILKPEWETIFYTLSLGKHVAIEQRIRTPRVQKLNHHIAKSQQAVVLGPRTYRPMEQPQEIAKLRAHPSHSIRLSTVEDSSNQHCVTYLNRDEVPVSMLPSRSRSRSKEKRRQLIERTRDVPRLSQENWNLRDRFESSNRRVSPRHRRKMPSSSRIEYVSSNKKSVRESRKRPSWKSQRHKRGRKSCRPPRTYHVDIEITYDDDDENKKKQKDPRKPKQRAQCSETNITLPREECRKESYRPRPIKLIKLMRREELAKKSVEVMTAEEIQVPGEAEKAKELYKPNKEKLTTAEALSVSDLLTEHAPLMATIPLQQKPKSPPPSHQENKILTRKPAIHHHDTNAHKKKLSKSHQKSKQVKTHQGSKDKKHRRTKVYSVKGTLKKAS